MLKGISPLLSPDLLKALSEMGHGDEIVLADGNFPAASMGRRLIRCDGLGAPALLDAVLSVFPLDSYVTSPACLMAVVPGDTARPALWEEFRAIIRKHETFSDFEYIERFAFYERARRAYAVIATSEPAQYANIILKKGVIRAG